jgi:NitT/TauT family transport system substrate-binding protein
MCRVPLIVWCLGLLGGVGAVGGAGCGGRADGKLRVRAGHFPNITHAQGVLGHATGRFQQALGDRAAIDWKVFNAGPSAIEAIFAGDLDLTYIGPNPAINGHVRSKGEALRIVAGGCSGGAALVVRADRPLRTPADFAGRTLATPQLGNTQDVAARNWLLQGGQDWQERGGKVRVVPLPNPEQLALFRKGEVDGAWTVEPWVTRLVQEAGGRILVDEGDLWPDRRYVTTHLIVARRFLDRHPEIVRAWIAEHLRITDWINANRVEAARLVNEEIRRETGVGLPAAILQPAFARLTLTDDPVPASLATSARQAHALGFLGRGSYDLGGIYDLRFLNELRAAAGRTPVTP